MSFRLEMDAVEKKKCLPLPGIEFRSRCDQSHCVITILIEMSQLFVTELRKLGSGCLRKMNVTTYKPPDIEVQLRPVTNSHDF